jgi:hypothetical protein
MFLIWDLKIHLKALRYDTESEWNQPSRLCRCTELYAHVLTSSFPLLFLAIYFKWKHFAKFVTDLQEACVFNICYIAFIAEQNCIMRGYIICSELLILSYFVHRPVLWKTREHNVSESGCVSFLKWEGDTYCVWVPLKALTSTTFWQT